MSANPQSTKHDRRSLCGVCDRLREGTRGLLEVIACGPSAIPALRKIALDSRAQRAVSAPMRRRGRAGCARRREHVDGVAGSAD